MSIPENTDEWVCGKCGQVFGADAKRERRPDITGNVDAGNICVECLAEHETIRQAFTVAATKFANETINDPKEEDYLLITTAMMIGGSVMIELMESDHRRLTREVEGKV